MGDTSKNNTPNIFLYWGGNKLSYLRLLTIISFRRFNPDYKVTLILPAKPSLEIDWDTREQTGEYTGRDYLDDAKKLVDEVKAFSMEEIGFSDALPEAQKSDIVRIFMLLVHGGLWIDFDIIFFKPVPEDLKNVDFVCRHPVRKYYSFSFMGARKGSEVYSRIFSKQLNSISSSKNYQKYGTVMVRNMEFPGVKLVSMDLVWHYDSTQIQKIFTTNSDLPPESIGIHWYAGNVFTREWENKITPENYDKFDNILSIKLKELR